MTTTKGGGLIYLALKGVLFYRLDGLLIIVQLCLKSNSYDLNICPGITLFLFFIT